MSKRECTTCKQMCEKVFSITILKEMQNLKKGLCFACVLFFYDTVIGGMGKIKLVLSHRVLIEGNLATYTKDHSNIHAPVPNNPISENLFHTYNPHIKII